MWQGKLTRGILGGIPGTVNLILAWASPEDGKEDTEQSDSGNDAEVGLHGKGFVCRAVGGGDRR